MEVKLVIISMWAFITMGVERATCDAAGPTREKSANWLVTSSSACWLSNSIITGHHITQNYNQIVSVQRWPRACVLMEEPCHRSHLQLFPWRSLLETPSAQWKQWCTTTHPF